MYVCVLFLIQSILVCVLVNRVQINQLVLLLDDAENKRPKLRCLVVTSPPWGAFPNEPHDVALKSAQIKVVSC